MSFTTTNLRELRADIDAALKSVAEKHNISLNAGSARYTPTTATFKLEAVTTTIDGEVVEAEKVKFNEFCGKFGIAKDAFGSTFKSNGEVFTICGIKPKAKKYPILAKNNQGTVYKFSRLSVPTEFSKW